jgi:DNA primase catalytic core
VSDLIDAFDAEYVGESTLKHAIVDILESKRAESAAIRMVEDDALFQVAERSLVQYKDYDDDVRFFNALREVTNFLTLATEGVTASGALKHTDLLPVNHPESTTLTDKDFFTLRTMRAEWIAADARIESEEARAIIAAVYSSNPLSVEYQYHLARLEALDEGQVPSDLLLSPILAFGNPYAGRNSFWHRAMRADKQRRDDEGQFAEMGGGARFFAQLPNGRFISVVGKIAGIPENDPNGIDIEVSGVGGMWDGIYTVPSSYTHTYKAILPQEDSTGEPDYVALPSGANFVRLSDLVRKDLPTSWFESRSAAAVAGLKNVESSKSYATGDGYRLNSYDTSTEDKFREIVLRAREADSKFGAQIINSRGTDVLDPGKPVYELISTKRGQAEVVGYTQDWATAQKLATQEDEAYPEAENEPLPEAEREPAIARMESKPEDSSEEVSFTTDPEENKPAQWQKVRDNEYLDPYSGFLVRFGRSIIDRYGDGTPIALDNVFEITDFITNENLGVAFNWDGVSEMVSAIRDNRLGPDGNLPTVNRMADKVELSGLSEKHQGLLAVKPKEGETEETLAGLDRPTAAQLKYITDLYNRGALSPDMVDAVDAITTNPDNYNVRQAVKLIAILRNRAEAPTDEWRGTSFEVGKVAEGTALRQKLRDALAEGFPEGGVEVNGQKFDSPDQLEQAYRGFNSPNLKDALKALTGDDSFDLVEPPISGPAEVNFHEILKPTENERKFVVKFGENPDATLSPRRKAGLARAFNAIQGDIKNVLQAAFWDMQKNPDNYTNGEAQRLFFFLNNQDRVQDIEIAPSAPAGGGTAPAATEKQKAFVKSLIDEGVSLSKERIDEILANYSNYNVREIAKVINELKAAKNDSSSNSDNAAINGNSAPLVPKYLTTNITDEGRAPSPAMLAMIEFLLENKNIPAEEVARLLADIPDQPRKVIKDIIDELSLRQNKTKYSPVGALRTAISDPKMAPTPRMLRALERMRFRGFIPDDAVWEDIVKRIPNMFRSKVSEEFLSKFKDIEDAHDAALIKASMRKGYEVLGLRNGKEGSPLVEIPADYKPQFPGKYLGPTEEQINKAMEAQVIKDTGINTDSNVIDVVGSGNDVVIDEFLATEVLRADMARFRRAVRGALGTLAELINLEDRSLSVGAKKVLQRAMGDLFFLHATVRFGRKNPPPTAKEVDSRLSQIAEGILSLRPDGAGIYGTPRSRKASDKSNLTRAKSEVLNLMEIFKGGVGKAPAAPTVDRMVSLPVPVEKPRSPYVDPPAFIGSAFDAIKGMTDWNSEVIPFLKDQDMYIIDFETTGLRDLDDPDIKNDPVQIAVAKVRNLQVVDFFSTYINPESKLSAYTLKGVGDGKGGRVTPEFLQQFPSKKEAMQKVMDFIPQGSIIGGHNFYVFDREVFDRTMREAGLDGINPSGYVDTLGLARHMMPKWTPENPDAPYKVVNGQQRAAHTLEALVSYFGLSNNGRHEADADVYSTVDVLNKMLDRAQRGLSAKGQDFSFNSSENGWDEEKYNLAIEEYQDKSVQYWLSRYRTLMALQGLSSEEIEEQLVRDFRSISEGISLGDNRDAVIIPVIETIKNIPGGSYAVDTRDGRVGQVIGQAAGGAVVVRFLAPGGETEQKFVFEEVPPALLANVTENFISKNGVLLDFGMQVSSPEAEAMRIAQINQDSVVARLGSISAIIPISDVEIVAIPSSGEAANRTHKKQIIGLVEQLESRKALSRELANAYRAGVDLSAYTIDGANRLIARLGNAVDQFDLIEANQDIAETLPEGGFPAPGPAINKMAARAAKIKKLKLNADDIPDEILKDVMDEFDPKPTPEGIDILKSIAAGDSVGAEALAGVGKTTLAKAIGKMFQKMFAKKHILYVVFGKENQLEAERRMSKNVESRTMNSLAHGAHVNRAMLAKFRAQPSLTDAKNTPINLKAIGAVADNFGITRENAPKNAPHVTAERIAVEAFKNWLKSADKFPTKEHVLEVPEMGTYGPTTDEEFQYYIDVVNRLWKDVVTPLDVEEPQILVDDDMLMKNWALSEPNWAEVNSDGINTSGLKRTPSLVMIDEAQDINPVFLGMLLVQDELHKNDIQKFLIGDQDQQIFGFRGTTNAFEVVPLDRKLPLTMSFRFGQVIADVANKILTFRGSKNKVIGNPNISSSIVDPESMEDPDLIITRTNYGIIEAGVYVNYINEDEDDVVMAATLNFKQRYSNALKYLRWLAAGGINTGRKYTGTTPKEFVGMTSWDMFINAASALQNQDLTAMKNMIYKIKKAQRFEGNWEAIQYLQDLVDNMRIQRSKFSVPEEIGKSGALGGKIAYVIKDGRIILNDQQSKRREFGIGVWDNQAVLKLNGFSRGEDEETKFNWSAHKKSDGRKQLERLVSMLNGEDATVLLVTGHGAKGLERKRVKIWTDWANPKESAKSRDRALSTEELRLAYVALTRAEEVLDAGSLDWVVREDLQALADYRFADEAQVDGAIPSTPEGNLSPEERAAAEARVREEARANLPNVGAKLNMRRITKESKEALQVIIPIGEARVTKEEAIKRMGIGSEAETDRVRIDPTSGEEIPIPDRYLIDLGWAAAVEVNKDVYDNFTPGTAEEGTPTINRMASDSDIDARYQLLAGLRIVSIESSIRSAKQDLTRPAESRLYGEPDYAIEDLIKSLEDAIDEIRKNPLYLKEEDRKLLENASRIRQAFMSDELSDEDRDMMAGLKILFPYNPSTVEKIKRLDKFDQIVAEATIRLTGGEPSISRMASSGGDDADLDDPEDSVPASGSPVDDSVLAGYRSENQKFAEQMGQQMIDAIQKSGKLPWQKPWSAEGTLPTSGATGKVYRRYNLLWLNMVSEFMGYKGTRWYTQNHIKKLGGFLDSEAIGHAIAYVKTVKTKKKETTLVPDPERPGETISKTEDVEKSYAKIGWFTVYNEDDIRGIELPPGVKREPVEATEAQQIMMDSYTNHPPIIHKKQDEAYWSPSIDEIHLPELSQFSGPEELFATLAHEFVHSTNHPDRLNNRKDAMDNYGKHIASRAREELVAEIGAAMLGQIFNINVTYDNSVNYVNSWLDALKDDPAMVMEAATLAGKAVEYMLGGYWLSIEKGLVETNAETEYVPTEAIGAATGEITGIDGEFNGLGSGVNYRIEGDQVILLGNTKDHKDDIKAVSVDNNGRPFKFFWHGKSGTWRVSLGGEDAAQKRIEILKELRDRIAAKSSEAPSVDRMAAEIAGESDPAFVERVYKMNQDIVDYYHKNFMDASAYSPIIKYFAGRGFTKELAAKFQLGRAIGREKGGRWKSLILHLEKLGYNEEEMLASGVVNKNEDNGLMYDLFAAGPTGDDRIVFPIKNADGQVTGFVARSINPNETAKYMYSKTTAVSKKANSLFGIDVAKDAIKKRNQIIFVEGQMDALALHASGVDNAVAISGSAFGQGHLNVFEALVADNRNGEYPYPMITFFFDPDKAGQKAQDEAFRLLQNRGFEDFYSGSIIDLSRTRYDEKDPADIYKEFGPEGILDVVKNQKLDASYLMTQAYLAKDVDRLVGLIASIASPSEREELIKLYAESLGMSYNELKQLVDAAIQGRP